MRFVTFCIGHLSFQLITFALLYLDDFMFSGHTNEAYWTKSKSRGSEKKTGGRDRDSVCVCESEGVLVKVHLSLVKQNSPASTRSLTLLFCTKILILNTSIPASFL